MSKRALVKKTYKLFIGGKFVRSESDRYFKVEGRDEVIDICRSSRKDFRNAVVAARGAVGDWKGRTAYNRSQIIYRIAEMLESRKEQFEADLVAGGWKKGAAKKEVEQSIDRILHYAGWCDKYQQVFGSVNPVASNHFNFSNYEPQGVVAVLAPANAGLLGLVSLAVPAISGGNTVVAVVDGPSSVAALAFAEVLATSDVPGGVVNLLAGQTDELLKHAGNHMDVNAVVASGLTKDQSKELYQLATSNVKRVIEPEKVDWKEEYWESPYHILHLQEVKTTWHPIERISASGSKY